MPRHGRMGGFLDTTAATSSIESMAAEWGIVQSRSGKFEQFHVEDEGCIGWDRPASTRSVGQITGDDEFALATDLHRANSLGPAGDDSIEREVDRFAAIDAAVELRAVEQPSCVVHSNGRR